MSKREIKFRAFFPNGKWGLGQPEMVQDYSSKKIFENFGFWEEPNKVQYSQFTGFKDYSGQEIYEGDIVDATTGRFLIEFKRGAFVRKAIYLEMDDGVKVTDVMNPVHTLYETEGIERCTVIGNIYENGNLINL